MSEEYDGYFLNIFCMTIFSFIHPLNSSFGRDTFPIISRVRVNVPNGEFILPALTFRINSSMRRSKLTARLTTWLALYQLSAASPKSSSHAKFLSRRGEILFLWNTCTVESNCHHPLCIVFITYGVKPTSLRYECSNFLAPISRLNFPCL